MTGSHSFRAGQRGHSLGGPGALAGSQGTRARVLASAASAAVGVLIGLVLSPSHPSDDSVRVGCGVAMLSSE